MSVARILACAVLSACCLGGTPTPAGAAGTGVLQDADIEAVFDAPESDNPTERDLRKVRGDRFNHPSKPQLALPSNGSGSVTWFIRWFDGMSALPTDRSDLVTIGEVLDGKAFMSTDKTSVYSEFTVRVTDVVMKTSAVPAQSTSITITREGGAVWFAGGSVGRYTVYAQGMPRIGGRYAFFLKRNETSKDYSLVTAYELREGRIFALDGAGSSSVAFSQYHDVDEKRFLGDLRLAMGGGGKPGGK